ncbi:MAG TPA: hypothetical protein VM198_12725 [Longimicrobiales bacterium]|nr:hypothetical protein [Longimicrobiales bacterium]
MTHRGQPWLLAALLFATPASAQEPPNFGIEYRFGSIFSNVVNPRFGGRGGGEVFF